MTGPSSRSGSRTWSSVAQERPRRPGPRDWPCRATARRTTTRRARWLARALAERGVELDAAADLIDTGLTVFARNAVEPSPEDPPTSRLEITLQFGAMWDTAGWIAHKAGDTDAALGWLRAAWSLSEDPDVAEHLGDVLASAGRAEEAAAAYANAAARKPNPASAIRKLAGIAGAPGVQPEETERVLVAARTFSLQGGPAAEWKGDVDIAHDRTGRVLDVRAPGAVPPSVLEAVRAATVPFVAPPDRRIYRFDRRATITCSGAGAPCSAVLWRPRDVPLR